MADVEQMRLPDNSLYNIKDTTIRDEVKYKIYSSVEDILGPNTSGSATISGVYAAMPGASILICPANNFASTEIPTTYGTIEIVKVTSDGSRGQVHFFSKESVDGDYRMFLGSGNDGNAPSGTWIANGGDVDFSSQIYFNYSTVGPPLNVLAIKRNGVVYLTVQSCSRKWTGENSICTIPAGFRPPTQIQFPASASEYNATVYIQAYDGDTKVGYIGAPANTDTRIIFTISYPV